MHSILRQLQKYQSKQEETNHTIIEIKQKPHPYEKIVNELCDCVDDIKRKHIVNDALLGLNDFTPPSMVSQLYPIELAILYHLFYRHRLMLCSESKADYLLKTFINKIASRDGDLNIYMATLKNALDTASTKIFLYRVMLAAFGARGKWDVPQDHIDKEFGVKASQALGVPSTAKAAGRGLDNMGVADVEQQILGRITYMAFWHWSSQTKTINCGDYLALPAS